MSFKTNRFAALGALLLAFFTLTLPALAGDIMVMDPYARASSMKSTSGAAFMTIMNQTGADDHLVSAHSDVAMKVELHTHIETADGIMQMRHVEAGFPLPADGSIEMKRGGHHVMFMGIKTPFEQDDMITLTLVFEKAGEVVVQVPVDLTRKPGMGGMAHGSMKMGTTAPSN